MTKNELLSSVGKILKWKNDRNHFFVLLKIESATYLLARILVLSYNGNITYCTINPALVEVLF